MRRRSRATSKLANARSRKGKTLKAARHRSSSSADQETEVARLRRELDDAREQQAATADVLKAISRSTFDLKAILDTLAESAESVCEAANATIYLRDEDVAIIGAHFGPLGGMPIGTRRALNTNWLSGRAILEARTVHVADLSKSDEYPEGKETARLFGHRATLTVPLLRDETAIGGICVRRREARQFTDKQIALVQNFATQAVIAIENTRLLNELRQRTFDLTESLEQQTAMSEVLQAVGSSPGDLQPVLAAMLEKAVRLCDAKFGNIYCREGDRYKLAATLNTPPAFADYRMRSPIAVGATAPGRMLMSKEVIHTADLAAQQSYVERNPGTVAAVELGGVRTFLAVPIIKDDELIGALPSHAKKSVHSRKSRLRWSPTSPHRRLSPLRMRSCLMSCKSRSSSRPPLPMFCRSLVRRRASWSRFFRRCWKTRHASARLPSAIYFYVKATTFASLQVATHSPRTTSYGRQVR